MNSRVNKNKYIVVLILILMSFGARAQSVVDSAKIKSAVTKFQKKKINPGEIAKLIDTTKLKPFKPDPMKVVWMGAIIPGYGQIINRKYWKLPIVYGGFLGCAYAVTWNSSIYQSYNIAYRDISDLDPATNSFLDIIPKGRTIDSPEIGGVTNWANKIKTRKDTYRRYRDLSIIASIGYYALTIVDAYVDAQLYDFDISPDLSLRFQPTLLENSFGQRNTLGMQCCISLK